MASSLMAFFKRRSQKNWHPVKGEDTTTLHYWLNWRALLCFIFILTITIMASYLIKIYETLNKRRPVNEEEGDDDDDDGVLVYEDVWRPCLKAIHPIWLMAFRIFTFFVLLFIITKNASAFGGAIFYFYTDLTFTLLIIYFGFGSLLSMYGCYHHYIDPEDRSNPRQVAGFWGYLFQIMYQMVAGAVVLTDCVFWFIIVPSVKEKLYFLPVAMHSINVVFLLGDAAMNNLRFPWFRIAYFILWTCSFVVFQWIVHACIALWWPYKFLDLAHSLSPLWYFLVALMHVPCYGVFFLLIKLKHFVLLRIMLRDQ